MNFHVFCNITFEELRLGDNTIYTLFVFQNIMCRVKLKDEGIPKIRGVGQGVRRGWFLPMLVGS